MKGKDSGKKEGRKEGVTERESVVVVVVTETHSIPNKNMHTPPITSDYLIDRKPSKA